MKVRYTLLFILTTYLSIAQMPSFNWGYGYGGNVTDKIKDVAIDSKGNQIAVGVFNSRAIDMSASKTADSLYATNLKNSTVISQDVFISKYDLQGGLVWAYSIGNKNTDDVIDVDIDVFDNIFILGQFYDTLDMNVKAKTTNIYAKGFSQNIYFAKYDKDFNLIWVRSLGSRNKPTAKATAESFTLDNAGNVIIYGSFYSTVDFNPANPNIDTLTNTNTFDLFLAKYSTTGNLMWAKQFDVTASVEKTAYRKVVYNANTGSIYVGGTYYGAIDLDPSAQVAKVTSNATKLANNTDFYLAKYDTLGNFSWAKNIDNENEELFKSFDMDAKGNLYVTGQFEGVTDFNPSAGIDTLKSAMNGNVNSLDLFFAKYTSNGDYVWAKRISGSDLETPTYIDVIANGTFYLTGNFRGGTIDFDPSTNAADVFKLTTTGAPTSNELFVASYNENGEFNWAGNLGGISFDYGSTVNAGPKNTLYVTGYTSSKSLDINMNTGQSDTAFFKHSTLSGSSTDFFITSYGGCVVNSNITQNGNVLSALESDANATFQWIDCSNHKVVATSKTYTATQNGNYKCIVTLNNCTDSSMCTIITGMAVTDIEQNLSFIIYPNPSHQNLTIASANSNFKNKISNIVFLDMLGKEVMVLENENLSNSKTIDISNLNKGVYFVKIDSDIRKFIKQ